jgi:hypothetical protein
MHDNVYFFISVSISLSSSVSYPFRGKLVDFVCILTVQRIIIIQITKEKKLNRVSKNHKYPQIKGGFFQIVFKTNITSDTTET